MGRGNLARDQRQAVVLAALVALDLDPASLQAEFRSLASEGAEPRLVEDVIVQMAAYVGYPRAGRALEVYRGVDHRVGCAEGSLPSGEERRRQGTADYARINATALATIESAFGEIAGDLIELTFRSFGDVFASSRQPLAIRQLATVSALATLGRTAPQLRFHIGGAIAVGVTVEQLVEAFMWVQYLAGMPAAYNALVELKQALAAGGEAPPGYR